MSSENIPPPSKTPDTTTATATKKEIAAQKTAEELQQPPLKCPRCDSSNTKFCYYNNYSLTQPRHFCKTCRRYWTRGGALRNVPIGGGCRKTKRHKPSPSISYSIASSASLSAYSGGPAEYRFLGPPTVAAPAMEFQLGGLSLPRLHPATAGIYTQFIANSGAHSQSLGVGPGTGGCLSLDLLGLGATYQPVPNTRTSPLSHSLSMSLAGGGGCVIGAGGAAANGGGGEHTLTISSIESLSSINQEMHWKLQQQRLAMIYGHSSLDHHQQDDDNQQDKSSLGSSGGMSLFKNLDCGKKLDATTCPTEWLFNQLQTNPSPNNYGATNDHDINHHHHHHHHDDITTSCNNNNNHEDYNEVWATELHHHHNHHHQFDGLQ